MSATAVVEVPTTKAAAPSENALPVELPGIEHLAARSRPTTEPDPSPVERVCEMGPGRRLAAFEEGMFNLRELTIWAARFPEEVPLVNGEFPWIALTLADLD